MAGGAYVAIAIMCAFATGIVGRSKGSSFFIWFIVGGVLPILGLIAAFAYRGEDVEPERSCPRCKKTLKLHVQVCSRCGLDLELPPVSRRDPARRIGVPSDHGSHAVSAGRAASSTSRSSPTGCSRTNSRRSGASRLT